MAAVNLVTFLQGASLPTSSISTVVLMNVTEAGARAAGEAGSASWPRDFRITETESTWIGEETFFFLTAKIKGTEKLLFSSLFPKKKTF